MADEDLERLARSLNPERTVVFLGAGAAHASGAPLSNELCRYLESDLANGEHISDELAELASILERRSSRRTLVEAIVAHLQPLQPDGALVALAAYPWPSIYTTNYDLLLERGFERAGAPLSVVRSHFDWEASHRPGTTVLYKLHGCITQDRAFGHQTSMTITLQDYVESERYRSLLFDRFKIELAGQTACIIGHSLKDRDLQVLLDEALRLQREAAAPGRVHLLVHELDSERAAIWRARGLYSVVQGDLNGFVHHLAKLAAPSTAVRVGDPRELPHRLASCTIDVTRATLPANPRRLFYGGAASYGDIQKGYTFERDVERDLNAREGLASVILGVGGTGKTTLARRLVLDAVAAGWRGYEHRAEFPLQVDEWIRYEGALRTASERAVLLIDNCPPFLGQLNRMIHDLPDDSHLYVITTSETSTWKIRQKEPKLYNVAFSTISTLSSLSPSEVKGLLTLVLGAPELAELAERDFLRQARESQQDILTRRCRSDMFVCLKTLFSSETLDQIILQEYAKIETPFREVYKITAGLEAAGGIPHRQMILRVSGLAPTLVLAALDVLEGLVEEAEQQASMGIYVWRTRHEVIARLLSEYKYSEPSELRALLERAIKTANPTYFEEAKSLREFCSAPQGIRALPDVDDRIALYNLVTRAMPKDRVARHRLVGELLEARRVGDAESELQRAVSEVGLDPPLQRYKVRVQIARSLLPGLMEEDQKAILRSAFTEAEEGVKKYPGNKYMFFTLADVAEEWFRVTGERGWLEWTKMALQAAEPRLLDPDIGERLGRLSQL